MRPNTLWARGRDFLRSYWTPAGKQALANLTGLVVGTGVGHAAAFGSLLVVTSALGAEGFGRLSVAISIQTYVWTLAGLGMGGILLREVGRRPTDADRLRSTFLLLQLAAALVVAVGQALVVAGLPLAPDERTLYQVLAFGLPSLCLAMATTFDAAHRQALSGFVTGGCEAAALGVVLLLTRWGRIDLPTLGAVYTGKWLLMSGGQWVLYRLTVGRIGRVFDPPSARTFFQSGWPLVLTALLGLLPLTAGVFVVRWQAGDAEAGRYGLAAQFANAVLMVGTLGNRILLPHVNGEYGWHRTFVKKLILFGGLFWGGLAVAGAVAGSAVILCFLPPEYAPAVPALVLLCGAVACQLAGQVAQAYVARTPGGERRLAALSVLTLALYAGGLLAVPWVSTALSVGSATAAVVLVVSVVQLCVMAIPVALRARTG
jgi:O-antigen/teichoic acid export membrane protein